MKLKLSLLGALMLVILTANAQSDSAPENWFNLDPSSGVHGVSTEKMYADLLKNKKSKTVVVAVIDSGIDIDHEDLKKVIWVNEDEIPNNGKDDDNNGYVDDVHGWNFIGGPNGEHVNQDQLEITRLYSYYSKKFDGKSASDLSGDDLKDFNKFQKIKKEVEKKRDELSPQIQQIGGIYETYTASMEALEKHLEETPTKESIEALGDDLPENVAGAKDFFMNYFKRGASLEDLKGLEGYYNYLNDQYNFHYNPDFDGRSVVGDDYMNSSSSNYGNNDVVGPDAVHGTHVAGIIAAQRDNDMGMKGVADNVKIMVLRTVPNGDERDKDVANSIRYAVDNGATVINMSFGKGYSWDKGVVDDAVKYAASKDVLLVHAAGNSSLNLEESPNFPTAQFEGKKKRAKNWLEVGALHWKKDQVAGFSNYGEKSVDLFAPGVDLNSTVPGSEYEPLSGTSMASPVVAGVAAVIRSYYPDLSAKKVRKIILKSVVTNDTDYNLPGSKDKKAKLSDLSNTGGIVNVYKAVELASKKSKGLGNKSGGDKIKP